MRSKTEWTLHDFENGFRFGLRREGTLSGLVTQNSEDFTRWGRGRGGEGEGGGGCSFKHVEGGEDHSTPALVVGHMTIIFSQSQPR